MTRVRVECFTISLDGYGAGPYQDVSNPLGVGGTDLHRWLFPTRTFQRTLFGKEGGTTGVDDDFASRGFQNVGAWILGRNMFGPIRGPWPDMNWKGWWGANPPYHVPVFILTHHARPPLEMDGNTTFQFITGGMREALIGHERRPPEEMCGLVVGPIQSSSICVRASLMSCTLLSHRSCSVAESDYSKGLTCGLWDTNALNL